jgi:hypothetical protein
MALAVRRFRVLAFLALAGAFALIALGEPAGAVPDCRNQVIEDWFDNGRVDSVYRLECYQDAIESMPSDIRDYTDAPEKIERALSIAARETRVSTPGAPRSLASAAALDTAGAVTFPLPLVVLAGLAAVTVAGGAIAYARGRAERGERDRSR